MTNRQPGLPLSCLCFALLATLVAPVLPAQRSWLDKLPAEDEAVLHAYYDFDPVLEPVDLPGDGALGGLAVHDGLLWLARGGNLLAVDLATGAVAQRQSAPEGLQGMAGDGRFVYLLLEKRVAVFDATARQVVRSYLLPDRDESAGVVTGVPGRGLAVVGGELSVWWRGGACKIDRQTGASRPASAPDGGLLWLLDAGEQLLGGESNRLGVYDGEPLRCVQARELPCPVLCAAGVAIGERVLCAFDHLDARGERRQVAGWLRPASDVELLTLKIYRDDQGPKYEVGPKAMRDLVAVRRELDKIAAHPSTQVVGADGQKHLMRVELQPYPGVRIKDLAAAWDVVAAAGFNDVLCSQAEGAKRAAAAAARREPR